MRFFSYEKINVKVHFTEASAQELLCPEVTYAAITAIKNYQQSMEIYMRSKLSTFISAIGFLSAGFMPTSAKVSPKKPVKHQFWLEG